MAGWLTCCFVSSAAQLVSDALTLLDVSVWAKPLSTSCVAVGMLNAGTANATGKVDLSTVNSQWTASTHVREG